MNMIRTIISLVIIMIFLPLSSLALKYVSRIDYDYSQINDEIAIYQLRELLLIAYDMHISNDEINFTYQDKTFRLSLVNGRLLLQPGTQIYLDEIDNLYFEESSGLIYINYEKNNKQYQKVLTGSNGIHLDEFSDCTVSDDVVDSDEE